MTRGGVTAILILRTSAIGDVVMSSHLVEGLRRQYPNAKLCWLAEPQVKPLLEQHPALDKVLLFPKSRWKELFRTRKYGTLFKEVRSFIALLRSEKFDVAIDAQGLFRSRLLAWVTGARERIGFASREPGASLMTRLISKDGDTCLMGSEYFYLLQAIGVSTAGLQQTIYLGVEHYQEAAALSQEAGINGPYAVFAPFTTRPQKHWFNERWIELAQSIVQDLALPVVWLGGPADQPAATLLAANGGGTVLAGQTGLAVSAAVIANASLLIGVDTGLTHMGSAFGIPTIALFGATCPYTKTCSPHTVVLYHPLPCSPCRRSPTCDGRFDCMQLITVAEVLQTAAGLLSSGEQQ